MKNTPPLTSGISSVVIFRKAVVSLMISIEASPGVSKEPAPKSWSPKICTVPAWATVGSTTMVSAYCSMGWITVPAPVTTSSATPSASIRASSRAISAS